MGWSTGGSGGGGGATTLNDLTDVTITSPADNALLSYDSGSSQWIDELGAGGGNVILAGTLAARPAASSVNSGDCYFATDASGTAGQGALYRSDGASWDRIATDREWDDAVYAALSHNHNASDINAGTLALARGGTNVSAASATDLFNQIDPLTTRGDLIRRGASDSERVALGTSGYVLGSDGTDALWVPTPRTLLTQDFLDVNNFSDASILTNGAITGLFPANSLAVGDTLRIVGGGQFTTTSASTMYIYVSLGGTNTPVTLTTISVGASSTRKWWFDILFSVDALGDGSTGTIGWATSGVVSANNASLWVVANTVLNSNAFLADTTAAIDLDIRCSSSVTAAATKCWPYAIYAQFFPSTLN